MFCYDYAILQLKYFWKVTSTRAQYEPPKVLNLQHLPSLYELRVIAAVVHIKIDSIEEIRNFIAFVCTVVWHLKK